MGRLEGELPIVQDAVKLTQDPAAATLRPGNLIFHNDRKMTWQWHRNVDGEAILRDEVLVCNTAKGMPASCGKPGAASKLDKMNPASGSRRPHRPLVGKRTYA